MVKKETVTGIIGNTQGVINAINPPKKPKRMSARYKNDLKAYFRNQSKWKAARKWAEKRDWEFIVLTEKELGIR